MQHVFRLCIGTAGVLLSGGASAHVGFHPGNGLAAGLAHPFMGLDHLLAMVAVGAWAVQLGGRSLPALPTLFVSMMAAGAVAGAYGVPLPQVESALALSVLVLGLLVALSLRAAWYWAVPLVGAVALFHGHAHGAEMPDFAQPWVYFAGFLIATAALHAIGACGGIVLRNRSALRRCAGAAIGLAGGWLLLFAN